MKLLPPGLLRLTGDAVRLKRGQELRRLLAALLNVSACDPLIITGRLEEVSQRCRVTGGLIERLDLPITRGALVNLWGIYHYHRGEKRRALGLFKDALVLIRRAGDRQREGRLLANLAQMHSEEGEVDRAFTYIESALSLARSEGDRSSEAKVLSNRGAVLHLAGRLDEALDVYREAVRAAEELGDPGALASALFNEGDCLMDMSKTGEARERLDRAALLFAYVGNVWGERAVKNTLMQAGA